MHSLLLIFLFRNESFNFIFFYISENILGSIIYNAASNPYLGGPNITPHYNQLTGGLMETERDRAAREARDREQQVLDISTVTVISR